MKRSHLNTSYIMPEFCEVGYSATLARTQRHSLKGWGKVFAVEGSECMIKWQTKKKPGSHSIADLFLIDFHRFSNSDNASEAALYPEFAHEATDPRRPCAQPLSRIPRRRAIQPSFFCSFCCITTCQKRACAAVCDSHSDQLVTTLHPNTTVRTSNAHFMQLSQSVQLVPSFRFLARTLLRDIILASGNLVGSNVCCNSTFGKCIWHQAMLLAVKCTATARSESASGIRQSCW